jgi:hypothetical protein
MSAVKKGGGFKVEQEFLVKNLREGKKEGIRSKQLFEQYKQQHEGMKMPGYDKFRRELRKATSKATREGMRIIRDNDGVYLAASNEEWETYKTRIKNLVEEHIFTVSECENKPIHTVIREMFFGDKKPRKVSTIQEQQYSFL